MDNMKNIDNKALRRRVTFYIVTAMIILVVATVSVTEFLQKQTQDQREKEYATQVQHSMEHTISRYFKEYKYRVRRMVETTQMVEMIKQRDRDGLYDILKKKWDIMKEEDQYLTIMHIHLADGTSFLRMHKKDKFSDELSSIRPMIKEIHSSHKRVQGYETGKYSNVYRTIYPIFDKDETYIGAMELGVNSNFILNTISEINGCSEVGIFSSYLFFILIISIILVLFMLVWLIHGLLKSYGKKVSLVYKEQMKQLETEENKLKNIFNAMEDGVYVVDKNFDIEYVNPGLVKDFGDYKGRKCYEYFHGKDDVCSWCKNDEIQNGKTVHWEWYSDKNNKTYDLIDAPLYNADGSVSKLELFRDITKLKHIEEELRASRELFYQFMENIPYTVFIKDENFKIIYVNAQMHNYLDEDVIGKRIPDSFNKETAMEIKALEEKAQIDGVAEKVIKVVLGDRVRYSRIFTFAIPRDKKITWIGMFYIDITENYLDKEKLKNQEKIMIAQSRHAAMGEMISMIAHQWRQPISVIAMDANNILADIELDIIDSSELKEGATDIIEQTQELSKTIDDFRNFLKPKKNSEDVLIENIVDDALGVIGKSLKNNDIELDISIDKDIKIKIYARELMQVVINIVKNAKEVLVDRDIEDRYIAITAKESDEDIILEICDNAGGIDDEIIDKIFNPYFTTKGEKNGTGLGLYMSKIIIEKHLQGFLSVQNRDNGACFIILIAKEEKV